ncbi:MAG: hypothetical protein SNH01_08985 [Rikenellaceae bacterium]
MRIKLLCAMALLLGSCAKDNGELTSNTESETQLVNFELTKGTTDVASDLPETYRFTTWYISTSTTYRAMYEATGTYIQEEGTSYLTPWAVDSTTGEKSSDANADDTSNGLQASNATMTLSASSPAISPTKVSVTTEEGNSAVSVMGFTLNRADEGKFYFASVASVYMNGFGTGGSYIYSFTEPLKEQRATITLNIVSGDNRISYPITSITYEDVAEISQYHPYLGHYVDYDKYKDYELVGESSDKLEVNGTTQTISSNATATDGKFNLLAIDHTTAENCRYPTLKVVYVNNLGQDVTVEFPLYRNFTPQLNYIANLTITSVFATLALSPAVWEDDSEVDGSFNDSEFDTWTVDVKPYSGDDDTWESGGNISGSIDGTTTD